MKRLLLLLMLSLLFLRCTAPQHQKLYIVRTSEELQQLTWANIDFWLEHYNIQHADVVKAQIWLETGNLTSQLCKVNNNLYGMQFPRVRETTAVSSVGGMAHYTSWTESIADYKLWQDRYYKEGNYYQFLLSCGYAEDPNYIKKLKLFQK